MPNIQNKNDKIAILIEMQRLTDDVQAKTEQLKAMFKQIEELNNQHAILTKFYRTQWSSLHDDHEQGIISNADLTYINEQAQSKAHSVLSEDGIWNVLIDANDVQVALLKLLAKNL